MYGLFVNTYDYHHWNDLVIVSDDRQRLIDYCREQSYNFVEGIERDAAEEKKKKHFSIEHIIWI